MIGFKQLMEAAVALSAAEELAEDVAGVERRELSRFVTDQYTVHVRHYGTPPRFGRWLAWGICIGIVAEQIRRGEESHA